MLVLIFAILTLAFFYGDSPVDSPEILTAVKGLDPIELVQGREVQGAETFSVVRGKFRYFFASAANQERFEKNPQQFSIQLGGACGRMGPLSGLGAPDRFFAHDGRIYIFASESCRNNFKSAPEQHLDAADAPPAGTAQEQKRAQKLIQLALDGFGGAEKVDTVTNLHAITKTTYKHGDGTADYVTEMSVIFPDKYRSEQSWLDWRGADVVNANHGFRIDNKETWEMEASERDYMIRQYNRHPLVILKARQQPGFRAFAAGRGKVGETEVEWLKVGIHGATSTLGIDLKTGRVLSVAYQGRVGGPIGDVLKTFSDFREADGLRLPFTSETFFYGEPLKNGTSTYHSVILSGAIDPSLFVK
jgi:YHS domain-containing protein